MIVFVKRIIKVRSFILKQNLPPFFPKNRQSQARNHMPNTPPSRDDCHAAKSVKKIENQH